MASDASGTTNNSCMCNDIGQAVSDIECHCTEATACLQVGCAAHSAYMGFANVSLLCHSEIEQLS